jgi:hypothetical protein
MEIELLDYLGKKTTPVDASKKAKYDNKSSEACRLIRMSLFSDLGFHLQGVEKPDDTWENMETVFYKHNEI